MLPTQETPTAADTTIDQLIQAGLSSNVVRVRRAAEKAADAAAQLRELVENTKERRAAEAKVERLRNQLEQAQAELRGVTGAKPARPYVNRKALMEWATANGIEVPARGRVPDAIIEKYLARPQEADN